MKVELLRVRPAVRAIEAGVRFARAHGRPVHRARALCATAGVLQLRRPRDWMRRAERLYGRAARDLQRVILSTSKIPVVEPADPEPVERRAYRLLYLAQAPYRRMALAIGALVSVVLLALVIVIWVGSAISPAFRARVFPRDLAARRPWVASNAVASHARTGIDPSSKGPGPFFHTEPSDHPWIEIDLGAPRVMRRLHVENRLDCCMTAGLPLDFDVFDEARGQWHTVAQRRAGFREWNRDFDPVRAQRVRLRVAGSGILSLRRISLYQW